MRRGLLCALGVLLCAASAARSDTTLASALATGATTYEAAGAATTAEPVLGANDAAAASEKQNEPRNAVSLVQPHARRGAPFGAPGEGDVVAERQATSFLTIIALIFGCIVVVFLAAVALSRQPRAHQGRGVMVGRDSIATLEASYRPPDNGNTLASLVFSGVFGGGGGSSIDIPARSPSPARGGVASWQRAET